MSPQCIRTYLPRLKDYPQYCQHITCIDHFKEFPAHLVEWVEYGVQSAAPPSKPHGPVLPPQLEALIKGQAAAAAAGQQAAQVSLPSARAAAGTVGLPKQPATSVPSAAAIGTAISTAAAAAVATTTAAASSAPGSGGANAIVRPTPIAVGGRPSIANTTNIDTLLNARSKVGVEKKMAVML